jgi:hypothetical protein
MDFLLECIGFPPDSDLEALAELARARGEPAPWRGPGGEHYRLPLGDGLDLRFDREEGAAHWSLQPYYRPPRRVRLAVEALRAIPDSPFDALVTGWCDPPLDGPPAAAPESFPLAIVLTDRRRLPQQLEPGHVLAVSLAGFALEVSHVGPLEGAGEPSRPVRRLPTGGWIAPLGGVEDPGGCVELCLPLESVAHGVNPLSRRSLSRVEARTPGKPLALFVSHWQLESDRLPAPRPGWCVQGTFLLTGRIEGGLESPAERLGASFG